MCGPTSAPDAAEAFPRYLFIVARDRPEILARVQERLQGDPRVEVIADRRYGERRTSSVPPAVDRRRTDRRRATKFWDDLTVHPTLVAQKRLEPYTALLRRTEVLSSANEELCLENRSLRVQIASLQRRIDALVTEDDGLRAAAGRLCAAIATLQSSFSALAERLRPDAELPRSRRPR